MSCVIYLNFLHCCQCKNRYQIAKQQKRTDAGLQSSYSKSIRLNCALTSDLSGRFLHVLLNWLIQKGESKKRGEMSSSGQIGVQSWRGAVLGGKDYKKWWMEWCSSCNDVKVSKSSAESSFQFTAQSLSLQCGWWPEIKRSQVQAVEMGFLSRAARISLRVGVRSLDIQRRKHRWSQRGGIPPPRQTAEIYRLEATRCFLYLVWVQWLRLRGHYGSIYMEMGVL